MPYTSPSGNSASTSQILMYSSQSDHLPLKKFLNKNTMNAKVNNWAVEHESYNLKFEYIQGIKNTLADTLSRLIEINPDIALPAEQPGQEFGYNFFEDLPLLRLERSLLKELKSNWIQILFSRKLT